MKFTLEYDKAIPLDAEDLAETGIKEAYDRIAPKIRQYTTVPLAEVREVIDNITPSYLVRCRDVEYSIYTPDLPDEVGQSWGRATYTLFKIVNDQLTESEYRLYAINGGNDLFGIFLTHLEAEAARKSLARKEEWPYMPTLAEPWYGQFHG